jgi:hypothetical protein
MPCDASHLGIQTSHRPLSEARLLQTASVYENAISLANLKLKSISLGETILLDALPTCCFLSRDNPFNLKLLSVYCSVISSLFFVLRESCLRLGSYSNQK